MCQFWAGSLTVQNQCLSIRFLLRTYQFLDCPESILFYQISIENVSILRLSRIDSDTFQNQCFAIRFLLRTYHFWAGWRTVQNHWFSIRFLLKTYQFWAGWLAVQNQWFSLGILLKTKQFQAGCVTVQNCRNARPRSSTCLIFQWKFNDFEPHGPGPPQRPTLYIYI